MAESDDASLERPVLERPVRRRHRRPGRSWAWWPEQGRLKTVLFGVVLVLGAALVAARAQTVDTEPPSGRHGDGHAQMHDIYEHWHPPLNPGTSCCNNADCRPTRAYVDNEGQWRAWNGAAWLPVPQERVLPADYAGDGRSHLCEKAGFVYCFTPGEIRG
jgi:hypothetical protein